MTDESLGGPRERSGRTPDRSELVELHECILSTDVRGESCETSGCKNDALVIASVPCHHICIPVCGDCLPEHIRWCKIQPEEFRAQTIAEEIAASLNPGTNFVREQG